MGNKRNLVQTHAVVGEIVASERSDTLRDIRKVRETLGEFTLRDMHEAVYGEEFTNIVLGAEGGAEIKMWEIDHDLVPTGKNGEFRIGSNREQLREILIEAHPEKTPEQIEALLEAPKQITKQSGMDALKNQEDAVEEAAYKAANESVRYEREQLARRVQQAQAASRKTFDSLSVTDQDLVVKTYRSAQPSWSYRKIQEEFDALTQVGQMIILGRE